MQHFLSSFPCSPLTPTPLGSQQASLSRTRVGDCEFACVLSMDKTKTQVILTHRGKATPKPPPKKDQALMSPSHSPSVSVSQIQQSPCRYKSQIADSIYLYGFKTPPRNGSSDTIRKKQRQGKRRGEWQAVTAVGIPGFHALFFVLSILSPAPASSTLARVVAGVNKDAAAAAGGFVLDQERNNPSSVAENQKRRKGIKAFGLSAKRRERHRSRPACLSRTSGRTSWISYSRAGPGGWQWSGWQSRHRPRAAAWRCGCQC